MKDVAERAGVSRTTVSLVLNGRDEHIPEATRRRVQEAARELNFRPSMAAQQLRTRRSLMVGMIGDEIATGPFAGGLIAGAQAGAGERGHAMVIMNTGREGDLSADLGVLEDRDVDALIFATVMTRPVRLDRRFQTAAVVLLNCFDERRRFPCVLPDDRRGGATATRLALEEGHRRVAWIGGEKGAHPAIERLKGFHDMLAQWGIEPEAGLVRHGNWHADSGYEETRRVLSSSEPPTALVCGNDRIALGAYEAVKAAGLRVPEDISVIGYDDQEEIVNYTRPPLTTVRIPYYEMGELAAKRVLDGNPRGRVMLECVPVMRGSLAAPPGKARSHR